MKTISYENIETAFPRIVSAQNDNNYLNMYSFYHELVTKYLIKKFDLALFDKYFSDSTLNYKNISEDQMDIYQYLSSSNLKYYYLRNNIHLERLEKEEYEFFIKKLDSNNEELNEETEKMIESTMSKVLSEKVGDTTLTNFGPDSRDFFAQKNSLIIGFRYDEFNDDGMTDDEWDKNHEKQIQDKFHQNVLLEIKTEGFNIMPVKIIEYDMFSVKKKINDNNKMSL